MLQDGVMSALLPFMMALAAAPPVDHPKTYLLSIVDLPVKAGQMIDGFSFTTWAVEFNTVCHIPPGWKITAGGSIAPDAELSGEGGQGVTWLRERNPDSLKALALVTLYGPVQKETIYEATGEIPATFAGKASVWDVDAEDGHDVPLTADNIRLVPAKACPSR